MIQEKNNYYIVVFFKTFIYNILMIEGDDMAKKKDVQEELMKTHVLNLNEIREAEKKDKIEKRKKTPIALLILGIILIIIGISYSIFLTHKKLNAPQKTEKEKNEITCISNLVDNIFTKTTYKFSNQKLISGSTTSTIVPIDNANITSLPTIQTNLVNASFGVPTYSDLNGGISLAMLIKNNTLNINANINYTTYIYNEKQAIINRYINIPNFTKDYNLTEVKKESEKLGALCN